MNNTNFLGEDVLLLEREFSTEPFHVFGEGKVIQETETRVNVEIYTGKTFFGREKYISTWWIKDGDYRKIEVISTVGITRITI